MGVPGLFSYLIHKYNTDVDIIDNCDDDEMVNDYSVVKDKLSENIKKINLFLDFNGGIYQVINTDIKNDDMLITQTLKYLDQLVTLYTSNDKYELDTLYIALDGVPPRAKMEQQRIRRYHSKHYKQKRRDLYDKFADAEEANDINELINTNIITPGTNFMKKLDRELNSHIKHNELYKSINYVIFNSWTEEGEGEHKIMDFIYDNMENLIRDDIANIIYGLDGDLIMLTLATHMPNIFLLRESKEYGDLSFKYNGHDYLYMDINYLRCILLEDILMTLTVSLESTNDENRFIDDYICLMMLLGNDFMPKIRWFNISSNGHKLLLECYSQVLNAVTQIDRDRDLLFLYNRERNRLNHKVLSDIVRLVSLNEDKLATAFKNKRARYRPFIPKELSKYKKRCISLDYFPLQFKDKEMKYIWKDMRQWRSSYYHHCLRIKAYDRKGIGYMPVYDPSMGNLLANEYAYKDIEKIVHNYLKTYKWNINYYLQGHKSCDWEWYYQHDYAPCLTEISSYLETYNINRDIKLSSAKPKAITPDELLCIVLPPSDHNIMPLELYDALKNNSDYFFPQKYELNVMLMHKYYECTPIIPKINIKLIHRIYTTIKK